MNFIRICYFLIALLVCQTAVAFYDGHEERQDITQHVPLHHQDGTDGNIHLDEHTSFEHPQPDTVQDCHHCCHCHGSACAYMLVNAAQWLNSGAQQFRITFQVAFAEGHFSAFFRPPIA